MTTSLTPEFDEDLEVLDNNVTANIESGVQTPPRTNPTLKYNNYTNIKVTIVIGFVGVVSVTILWVWCSLNGSHCPTS